MKMIVADVSLQLIAIGQPLILLAQGMGFDTGLLALVGNGVTVAVLAWYVVYDVRVRTPSMQAAFSSEQKAMRDAFTAEQKAMRDAFTNAQTETHKNYSSLMESVRQTFGAEQAATRQTFAVEQSAIRARYEADLTEYRKMLFENMLAMRGAVHDVKDTAQTLMSRKALQDQLAKMGEEPE